MAPIANLTVRLSAQIAEFQKEFRNASKTASKFADEFEGIATRASAVGSFFGNIAADIAKSLARGLAGAISDAVKFSSQFSNAFIGLSSVARAFGTNTDAATAAARRLSADGLLPLKDSATGLKNLLAAGFNLPQATKLMDAFKDSAAFGRQGALSFGDAVRSATEGVKNGNSILVDNAGVTKNLSQILKEAGFSAQDLSRASSDAGVRMALFNGILKETRAQTGDANTLTKTFTGTLEGMKTSWTNLLAVWGDAITKNRTVADTLGFVRDAFSRLSVFLSDNRRGFLLVSDAIIAFVGVLAATVRAINAMHTAFSVIDTALVTVARSALQAVNIISESLLELVKLAAKLPGGSAAIGIMASEVGSLLVVADKTANGIETLTKRIESNKENVKTWDTALTGVASELDGLAKHLKDTRGQTVELGVASDHAGMTLRDGLGGGADAASGKLTSLGKTMSDVANEVESVAQRISDSWTREMEALDGVMFDLVGDINKVNTAISDAFQAAEASDEMANLRGEVESVGRSIDMLSEKPKHVTDGIGELARALSQLAQISDGAFGSIARGLSTMVGAVDVAAKAIANMSVSTGKIALDFSKAGFLDTVSGLLALASAAVQAGHALGGLLGLRTGKLGALLGTNATGRQAVIDFASTFGGFDELHKKLQDVGAEGEALWIKLTQGVSRSSPAEAAAAIALVNAALAKHEAALVSAGSAATQAGQAEADAFAGLRQRISDLGSEYDSLFKSIQNEAPEEVMGVVEQQTRARMDAIRQEQSTLETELQESLASLAQAAKDAATTITDALSSITIDPIVIDVRYRMPSGIPAPEVPALARGGIVRRPTLALIGEAGPEAVVPLSGSDGVMPSSGGGDTYVSQYYVSAIDSQDVQRFFDRREAEDAMERKIKRPGVVQSALREALA